MCGIAPSIRVPAFQKTVEALPNRGSTTVSAACSRCKDAASSLVAVSSNARRDDEILAWAQAPTLGKALPGDGGRRRAEAVLERRIGARDAARSFLKPPRSDSHRSSHLRSELSAAIVPVPGEGDLYTCGKGCRGCLFSKPCVRRPFRRAGPRIAGCGRVRRLVSPTHCSRGSS